MMTWMKVQTVGVMTVAALVVSGIAVETANRVAASTAAADNSAQEQATTSVTDRLAQWEIVLTDADAKKLSAEESTALAKADKLFAGKEYRQAMTAYDAFLAQSPKSIAIPYAIARKGRCLQLDNKRQQAILIYEEVLDYFPNRVTYAAAALYFTGESHEQDGNRQKAIATLRKLMLDKDYKTTMYSTAAHQMLAALAIKENGDTQQTN